ncbi:hypothetical protein [Vibrio atypicus]|jgi:hypothetical protein|uniref:hypothetical protein n=1 Tax=Vibrio atypicus TaxID=558271 RepID=UPI001359D1E8|nr:hypothetical protein [Vibrio atypicus]
MNKATAWGSATTLLTLIALIYLLAGDSHFPFWQWPYEALQGLVFSFVWGFGISEILGFAFSIGVFITVAIVSFAIGHKLGRCFNKP